MTTPYGQKVVTVTAVVVAAAAAVVNDDRNSRLCWKSLTFWVQTGPIGFKIQLKKLRASPSAFLGLEADRARLDPKY